MKYKKLRTDLPFTTSAFTKSFKEAKAFAKLKGAKIRKTNHITRGKGWLIFKQ
jgi:hypothetical protein